MSVLSYVLVMRERLEKNLAKAQYNQKQWYDHCAHQGRFMAGVQVLVLLPTTTPKVDSHAGGKDHMRLSSQLERWTTWLIYITSERAREFSMSTCWRSGAFHLLWPNFAWDKKKKTMEFPHGRMVKKVVFSLGKSKRRSSDVRWRSYLGRVHHRQWCITLLEVQH